VVPQNFVEFVGFAVGGRGLLFAELAHLPLQRFDGLFVSFDVDLRLLGRLLLLLLLLECHHLLGEEVDLRVLLLQLYLQS
jgi:hypothetical protein